MTVLTLAEKQSESLRVLRVLVEYCDRHALTYYAAYGTLLGAVRHGGPIPWDDDIDVIMPRPDYDLLVECFNNEHPDDTKLLAPGDEDYPIQFAKVVSLRTAMAERNALFPPDYGVFVDVFPLDGLPRIFAAPYKFICNALARTSLYSYGLIDEAAPDHSLKSRIRHSVGKTGRLLPRDTYTKLLNRVVRMFDYEKARSVAVLTSPWPLRKERINKSQLRNPKGYLFSDLSIRSFAEPESILEKYYGSDWRIPIRREQASHGEARWIEDNR